MEQLTAFVGLRSNNCCFFRPRSLAPSPRPRVRPLSPRARPASSRTAMRHAVRRAELKGPSARDGLSVRECLRCARSPKQSSSSYRLSRAPGTKTSRPQLGFKSMKLKGRTVSVIDKCLPSSYRLKSIGMLIFFARLKYLKPGRDKVEP